MSRKMLFLFCGGLLAVSAAVFLPVFSYASNCGGNSAALSDVREYVLLAQLGAMDSPDHSFRVSAATTDQRKQLANLARDYWLSDAHFLVSTNPFSKNQTKSRRVVIIGQVTSDVGRRKCENRGD